MMSTEQVFTYRMFTPAEVAEAREELKNLALEAYGMHREVLTPENAQLLLGNLAKEETWDILFGMSVCFVCLDRQKIVGMAYLIPGGRPWRFFRPEWSYIRMVGVLPDYGNKGIGRKLTLMCIEYAEETGEKIVALHTSEYMNAARGMYEKLGFTVFEEIPPLFGKRYWIYTLKLN